MRGHTAATLAADFLMKSAFRMHLKSKSFFLIVSIILNMNG
jgi:hypothetical protein